MSYTKLECFLFISFNIYYQIYTLFEKVVKPIKQTNKLPIAKKGKYTL